MKKKTRIGRPPLPKRKHRVSITVSIDPTVHRAAVRAAREAELPLSRWVSQVVKAALLGEVLQKTAVGT